MFNLHDSTSLIPRRLAPLLAEIAGQYPVVSLTGPRQSGKTTLVGATIRRVASS